MGKNTITECLLYMQNPYQVLWETKIFIGCDIYLYSVPPSLEKKIPLQPNTYSIAERSNIYYAEY